MIADKAGDDVPFILNSAQRELDNNLTGRDIIPKARQEGISAYFLARSTVKCLHKRNTRAVVISHEDKSTQRMLNRVRYFLQNIQGGLKPVIGVDSRNEITFPKTNSMFYIGTAGSKKFGRGDTITDLHCSEAALWSNPKELTAGLFQAVPRKTGSISIESTGYGVGNWYHRRCMRAAAGIGRYKLHFFNWQDFEEYSVDLTDEEQHVLMENLSAEWQECDWKDDNNEWHEGVANKYNLTPGQIQFRRDTLEEMDYDLQLFKQEYPMTLDECFQATGRSLFDRINFVQTDQWIRENQQFWILQGHPKKDSCYIIGGDVGAGTGLDNSVGEIFELETLEQVGEWVSNRHEPDVFGYRLSALGRRFNNAFVTVENNNHGLTTIDAMRSGKRSASGEWEHESYPTYLMYRKPTGGGRKVQDTVQLLASFGYNTNRKSKPFIIGKLRKTVAVQMTIHSPLLLEELHSFIEHPDGSLGAEEGCKDDRVMSAAVCIANVERTALYMLPQKKIVAEIDVNDPFLLDNIIRERSQGRTFLIPSNTL